MVNQYGARPREARTLSHSSRVSSFSRFIQMLQVRHRELHFGDGESVRLSGSIAGQPIRRYSLNSGTRTSTPAIDFILIPTYRWLLGKALPAAWSLWRSPRCYGYAAACSRACRGIAHTPRVRPLPTSKRKREGANPNYAARARVFS